MTNLRPASDHLSFNSIDDIDDMDRWSQIVDKSIEITETMIVIKECALGRLALPPYHEQLERPVEKSAITGTVKGGTTARRVSPRMFSCSPAFRLFFPPRQKVAEFVRFEKISVELWPDRASSGK